MPDTTIVHVRGNSKIYAFVCYDVDGAGMVLTDAAGVIFSLRSEEDADIPILQKQGVIEYEGTSADDPGVVAVELTRVDTKDLPVGMHWYDVEVRFVGHWFDFLESDYTGDLHFPINGGWVRDGDKVWHEVESTVLELVDDTVNYIELSSDGVLYVNQSGFTEGFYPLYSVITEGGAIKSVDEQYLITDKRDIYSRGDRFITIAKDRFNIIYPITTEEESEHIYKNQQSSS